MDAMHYWPFAWEYSIWNTTDTALQFWTADLKPHILSNAIEWVYTAFFYSNSTQQLQNLPEEILFSCFVTTLNDTFDKELAHEDEGYKSGSENLKHSHSSQKSTMDISHLHEWELIFWSHHTTHHSWTTLSTLTPKIQKPQSCMLPFGV